MGAFRRIVNFGGAERQSNFYSKETKLANISNQVGSVPFRLTNCRKNARGEGRGFIGLLRFGRGVFVVWIWYFAW